MSHPAPAAVVELLKPITWFAPMWAFACGLISTRSGAQASWLVVIAGVLVAGPLVCATSQAVNDWFDRHVDAINEPGRPIPSGRIPGRWGLYIAMLWTVLSLLVAATLGKWGFCAAVFGLLLAWAYSAPPLRLKQNGWLGNTAVAMCYEGVPWVTGAAIMASGAIPDLRILVIAALYSVGAHGIMTLNDFKSVDGDRRMGIRSLPVSLGIERAGHVACAVMALAQSLVVVLLLHWGKPYHAAIVAVLVAVQLILMARLVESPRERAPWYNATGTSLYVLGMLVGRLCPEIGHAGDAMKTALGWGGIARLGLVQAAIGSIVVLATSTLNRVMVIELALPAVFPGLLVSLHYAVQMARTRVGHGSDVGGRLTSWIIGGMAVLAAGGIGAAAAVALMSINPIAGMLAAIVAYTVIGLGAGACGTCLLVLLAQSVEPGRRPAAATITWVMMFVGFVLTTAIAGQLLDPYSHLRLVAVVTAVALFDFLMTALAVRNIESRSAGGSVRSGDAVTTTAPLRFQAALAQVWQERAARRFTIFVFLSMLAYSGQELLLEPFVARVFQLTPGQSARVASLQHGGALIGMVLVAIVGSLLMRRRQFGMATLSLRSWTAAGCIASAIALVGLVVAALDPVAWPLRENVFVLGVANGVFAVAAIGSMMSLVSTGGPGRQGLRMGLWGAAQATAFAVGGALSSGAVDVTARLFGGKAPAYALVFSAQAVLFVVAGVVALCAVSGALSRPASPGSEAVLQGVSGS